MFRLAENIIQKIIKMQKLKNPKKRSLEPKQNTQEIPILLTNRTISDSKEA